MLLISTYYELYMGPSLYMATIELTVWNKDMFTSVKHSKINIPKFAAKLPKCVVTWLGWVTF